MKRAYLRKSDRGNRMHLIIPNAMSQGGYRNSSGGGQQVIISQEHKFKGVCNVDNRVENLTSAS